MPSSSQQSNETKIFDRSSFLNLPEPTAQQVYIGSLDAYVYMRELSSAEQESYEASLIKFVPQDDGSTVTERDFDGMKSKYLVRVLCDDKGKRLFGDDEYELLGRKFAGTIRELYDSALEVNGLSRNAQEEMRKNSETTESDDSNSGSLKH